MKKLTILCLALSLLGASHAFAQVPNPTAEHNWQTYLDRHPGLRQHPEWLNNPSYLKQNPGMTKWLEQHPAVFQQARQRGMWDQGGNWRDSSWWRQHDSNFFYQNHPEWAERQRDWQSESDEDEGENPGHPHGHHYGWEKHHRGWNKHHAEQMRDREWSNRQREEEGDQDER